MIKARIKVLAMARQVRTEEKVNRTLQSLIDEATESAQWRGHDPHFWTAENTKGFAYTTCKRRGCRAYVAVKTEPAPNEIDIGGDMVAVGCPTLA